MDREYAQGKPWLDDPTQLRHARGHQGQGSTSGMKQNRIPFFLDFQNLDFLSRKMDNCIF